MSHHIIAIKKLNNIIINCLWNPHVSVLSDKWHFDFRQDWEILISDFESFNSNDLADKTLQTLGFHISATRYLEEGSLYFTNITDLKLTVKPAVIDNPGWVITDSEKKVVKKKNKNTAKKKEQLAKLCAFVRFFIFLS